MQQCYCAADADVLVAAVGKQPACLLPLLALHAIQLPPHGLHRLGWLNSQAWGLTPSSNGPTTLSAATPDPSCSP